MMCFCKQDTSIYIYGKARYQIKNVDKYVCRGCKRSVLGNVNELKPLISHG